MMRPVLAFFVRCSTPQIFTTKDTKESHEAERTMMRPALAFFGEADRVFLSCPFFVSLAIRLRFSGEP